MGQGNAHYGYESKHAYIEAINAATKENARVNKEHLAAFRENAETGIRFNDMRFTMNTHWSQAWSGEFSKITAFKYAHICQRGDILLYELRLWVALFPTDEKGKITAIPLYPSVDDVRKELYTRYALRVTKVRPHQPGESLMVAILRLREKLAKVQVYLEQWWNEPMLVFKLWAKSDEVDGLRRKYHIACREHENSDLVESDAKEEAEAALYELQLFGAYKGIDRIMHPDKYHTPLHDLVPDPNKSTQPPKDPGYGKESPLPIVEHNPEKPPVTTATTTGATTNETVYVLV
jgi:hypothetical protein